MRFQLEDPRGAKSYMCSKRTVANNDVLYISKAWKETIVNTFIIKRCGKI